MKRLFFSLMLLLTSLSVCYAQQEQGKKKKRLPSYDEYIGIEKKDSTLNTIQKNEGKVIWDYVKAIESELFIIRQQYRLKRNNDNGNQFYGKNNKPYFGESYSLAVKVSGGTIFLSHVMEPWIFDPDYVKYKESGNYIPSLFLTYRRSVSECQYEQTDLELNDRDYVMPLNSNNSLYLRIDAKNDFGLDLDESIGIKDGYMIWAYSKTNVRDSAMVVDFCPESFSIEAKGDSTLVEMNPTDPDKLLGGIFVCPKFEKNGKVQYVLTGVAVQNKENTWGLHLFSSKNKGGNASHDTEITNVEEKQPKDSKKSKKNKKNRTN